MNLNLAKCSDRELAQVCVKYNIIQANELRNYTRETVVVEITKWSKYKQERYKQRKRSIRTSRGGIADRYHSGAWNRFPARE